VPELDQLTRPVVGSAAGFHANEARWRGPQQRQQIRSLDLGLEQHHLARLIDAMYGKNILGKINTNCNNGHGLPLSNNFRMDQTHFPSWRFDAVCQTSVWLLRDGGSPLYSLGI
jgi:hypothetical protein